VPLDARIVAVADCYDALLSERPYRSAFPEETVLRTIRGGRGTHFDPDVCTAFESCLGELQAIRQQLANGAVPAGAGTR
jgi:putative two-component system response regulator